MQKAPLFLAAFCLSCGVPAFAGLTQPTEPAVRSTAPPPDLDSPHWRTFTSEEGHFSVLLPSAPLLKTFPRTASRGVIHECIRLDGAKVYLIFYRDLPPSQIKLLGAEKVLAINDNAAHKVTGSSLISERPLTLNGCPGHEVITNLSIYTMRLRHTYIVGNRFFTLEVIQPISQRQNKFNDAGRFFNSFTLPPAKPSHLKR